MRSLAIGYLVVLAMAGSAGYFFEPACIGNIPPEMRGWSSASHQG